jgi:hypothetical protein
MRILGSLIHRHAPQTASVRALLPGIVIGLAALVGIEALTTSCQAPHYPGTTAGSFAISGTLVENTCAPGLDPHEALSFIAELRREDGVGYWRQEGGAIISGTMATNGAFHFTTRTTVDAYGPDRDLGTAGCSLYQTETIDGVLVTRDVDGGTIAADGGDASTDAAQADAGPSDAESADAGPSASFTGDNVVIISATPGSNCSLLLAANGGDFPSFPCQASYTLTGVAR